MDERRRVRKEIADIVRKTSYAPHPLTPAFQDMVFDIQCCIEFGLYDLAIEKTIRLIEIHKEHSGYSRPVGE